MTLGLAQELAPKYAAAADALSAMGVSVVLAEVLLLSLVQEILPLSLPTVWYV